MPSAMTWCLDRVLHEITIRELLSVFDINAFVVSFFVSLIIVRGRAIQCAISSFCKGEMVAVQGLR